jgi:hypothetical protein
MNQPSSPRRLPIQELILQLCDHTKPEDTTMDGSSVVYSLKNCTAVMPILLMTLDVHQHGIASKFQLKIFNK